MSAINPLPTEYKGVTYRSRTEARWAVFFDKNNIPVSYESDGFDLDGIRYLPDFLLPEAKVWFEVKPFEPSSHELDKARRLASSSRMFVFVAPGSPSARLSLIAVSPSGAVRDGFSFGYAHEQGVGYIADNFHNAQHAFKLRADITAPVGNYGAGAESELNEAGAYQFGWNIPKPPSHLSRPKVIPGRRAHVAGRDW